MRNNGELYQSHEVAWGTRDEAWKASLPEPFAASPHIALYFGWLGPPLTHRPFAGSALPYSVHGYHRPNNAD